MVQTCELPSGILSGIGIAFQHGGLVGKSRHAVGDGELEWPDHHWGLQPQATHGTADGKGTRPHTENQPPEGR